MNASYKYIAYISYSHIDSKWGDWLHDKLESYKVPRDIVGKERPFGIIPKNLYPIFRDREELPGSSCLDDNIILALKSSYYLIVICSPNSAKSIWVDKEIRIFKALGRSSRVLCLIIDGEPNATDKYDSGLNECFPESIRFDVNSNEELLPDKTEPIAADARDTGDGKYKSIIKLVSGLLGVGFDELWKREKRRKARYRIIVSVILLSFTILSTISFHYYNNYRNESFIKHTLKSIEYIDNNKPVDFFISICYIAKHYPVKLSKPFLLAYKYWKQRFIPLPDIINDNLVGLYQWNKQQYIILKKKLYPLDYIEPSKYGNYLIDLNNNTIAIQSGQKEFNVYSIKPFKLIESYSIDEYIYIYRIEKSVIDNNYIILSKTATRSIGLSEPIIFIFNKKLNEFDKYEENNSRGSFKNGNDSLIIKDIWNKYAEDGYEFKDNKHYQSYNIIKGYGIKKLKFPFLLDEKHYWEKYNKIDVLRKNYIIKLKDNNKQVISNNHIVGDLRNDIETWNFNGYLIRYDNGYTLFYQGYGGQYAYLMIRLYDNSGKYLGKETETECEGWEWEGNNLTP